MALLDRIPKYKTTTAEVLADYKGDKELTGKWDLSIAAIQSGRIVGVDIRYRRCIELPSYPAPTVYANGLAVSAEVEGTGVGAALFDEGLRTAESWIANNEPGICCSLQTNSAAFNNRVRAFYARRGFVVVGEKEYDNRTDVVMFRRPPP